jgi:small subunit ribosomal protein S17
MADENNENIEETPDAPVEAASAEEAPASEAGGSSEEAGTEVAPAPTADEAPADAAPADQAPADAAPADEAPPAAAEAAPKAPKGPPQEVIPPKERRQRARAAKAAKIKAGAPRTPEERQADRVAERRKKAEVRRGGRVKARAKASHTAAEATPPREHIQGVQKVRQGIVVSDKADKTITVRIDTARRHRRYEKIVRTSRTLHAHDERNDANMGDTVIVREARPLSRTKRWRLIEVVERAK